MASIDPPTQDERPGKLATPLGKDKLCLVRFEGHEAIGELFEFRIEAVSLDENIDFEPHLGKNCSVHLETGDNIGRDFSGVLTEARWVGKRFDLNFYRLVLRPWPWLLTLRAQCRIFKEKTIKQIVKEALGDGRYGPIDDSKVTDDFPKPEYTVQYRETDLNFALRLMETYGIYFYFDFDKGDGSSPSGHKMVLSNSTDFKKLDGPDSFLFASQGSSAARELQQFRDWTKVQGMVPGHYELNDYDYNKPKTNLLGQKEHAYPYDQGRSFVFDYPGGYNDRDVGNHLAKIRQEADARGAISQAGGYAPSLVPGFKITRTSTDGDPLDGDYLVRHCTHFYGDETYSSRAAAGGAAPAYDGRYELSISSIPYRMPLRSRRPVIMGTQPALVIRDEKAAAGEEIDVDDLGRIYVRFYWDVKAKEVLARRIRVAQVWAGKTRGALFTPRVGDEVVVAYEDGDPDRPIVVGSVYNGENTVPMTLPGKKVKSGWLTMSSKGGGGYNMVVLDDTKGQENIKIRTEKDLKFKALHDQEIKIGHDRTDKVDHDINQKVGNNHTIDVGVNYSLTAGTKITLTVGSSSITIDGKSITLHSPTININGDSQVNVSSPKTSVTG